MIVMTCVSRDDLVFAAARLGVQVCISASVRWGWNRKSIGTRTSNGRWLRVVSRQDECLSERLWFGEEAASILAIRHKPGLVASYRWVDTERRLVLRGDLTEFATTPVLSRTAHAEGMRIPSAEWWTAVRATWAELQRYRTERQTVRQDLVSRRLRERWSLQDTEVREWEVCHGDFHWGNLCGPDLFVLDWESWGMGPRWLDAATLCAFSAGDPELCTELLQRIPELEASRAGLLSLLFMAAELLSMIERYSDHPHLEGPLLTKGTRWASLFRSVE